MILTIKVYDNYFTFHPYKSLYFEEPFRPHIVLKNTCRRYNYKQIYSFVCITQLTLVVPFVKIHQSTNVEGINTGLIRVKNVTAFSLNAVVITQNNC